MQGKPVSVKVSVAEELLVDVHYRDFKAIGIAFQRETLNEHGAIVNILQSNQENSEGLSWVCPEFQARDWINLLIDATQGRITHLKFYANNTFNVHSVRNCLRGHIIEQFVIDVNCRNIEEIISAFPEIQSLTLHHQSRDLVRLKSVWTPEMFRMASVKLVRVAIHLEEVLDLDLSCGRFWNSHLTNQDINTFFKKWANGWNRNLQCICLEYDDVELEFKEPVIFRGIDYQRLTKAAARLLNCELLPEIMGYESLNGGFKIERSDGTIATIHMQGSKLDMIVWDY